MPNLLVEIGNTALKAAYSEGLTLGKTFRYQGEKTTGFILTLIEKEQRPKVLLIASMREVSESERHLFAQSCQTLIVLDPVSRDLLSNYSLPKHLSYDRAAAIIAARRMFPGKSAALFDFGTIMSIDFIGSDGAYKGGYLSPGCRTRFKSMNRYSKSLPLVNTPDGSSKAEVSLQADMEKGVIKGMLFEIEGHLKPAPEVTVFTGGDAAYFADRAENPVFVVSNLVMMGLASIIEDYANE